MIRRLSAICLLVLLPLSAAQAAVRVDVSGLGPDEKTNVLARLTIRQQGDRKDLSESLVERLHEQAPADIRVALQPFGWYTPSIEAELSGSEPTWVAHYRVDAGEPTLISKIDVQLLGEGAEHEAFKAALRRANRRLTLGERLKHADYEEAKKLLTDAAYAGGFLDAYWAVSELRVNPDSRQAEIYLHLQTGPRYAFGRVTLQQDGEQGLNQDFVERYLSLKEGEPFDPQKLLDQQFALSDLGYFQSVEITPQRTEADAEHRVPLVIHTTPRKKHRYEGGIGYGTDTGARVSLGTEWRQINQWGHNLDASARVSQIKDTAAANYRVPQGAKPGENLTFSAIQDREALNEGDTSKYTFGASLNRHPGEWQRRLYLEYSHERSTFPMKQAVLDPVTGAPQTDPVTGDEITESVDQTATADLLTPGVSFTRTDSDDPIFAHRGWYVFADVHGAQKNALSSTSFVRTYLLTRGVYSLDYKTRLLGRVELGANFHDRFTDLPATQRFFAGGDNSVRGYSYESIGTDGEGNVTGGQYLATFSTELERRIKGNWGAAVFVDAGGADEVFLPKLYYGVGAGLRYRAPVGSFQVDLAHPLTGDAEGQFIGLRLHISVRVGL
ncbi:MAG: outer membrane protein assembly factor [Hydrocarboniphaga sp.]|uniref:autotransporter assembly complex protein TamA n=1 Tax=Hydrocarboniphaga sp. TaxID=2033016 RepID=UPI002635CB2A|nr:autotransporter assembly complex family protein [Hydrocarboniphaga sp.]MDB5972658.1 outer membrane protein assembly factor [Hydrocarboniphaga sp.]